MTERNTSEKYRAAFNAGCNARIKGRPISDRLHVPSESRSAWQHGWLHTQAFWGCDNPVARPLPDVAQPAQT